MGWWEGGRRGRQETLGCRARSGTLSLGLQPGSTSHTSSVRYQRRCCSDPRPGHASKSLESLRVTELRNGSGVQLCLNRSDQNWVSGPSGRGMQPSRELVRYGLMTLFDSRDLGKGPSPAHTSFTGLRHLTLSCWTLDLQVGVCTLFHSRGN